MSDSFPIRVNKRTWNCITKLSTSTTMKKTEVLNTSVRLLEILTEASENGIVEIKLNGKTEKVILPL